MARPRKAVIRPDGILLPIPLDGAGFIMNLAVGNHIELVRRGKQVSLAVSENLPVKKPSGYEDAEVLWSSDGNS